MRISVKKEFLVFLVFICTLFVSCRQSSADEGEKSDLGAQATPTPVVADNDVNLTVRASNTPVPTVVSPLITEMGEKIDDYEPIERAAVAKMLAMAFYDKRTIDLLEREVPFTDSSPEFWFDKYINIMYISGMMDGIDNKFMPYEPLTYGQAQAILDKMDSNNSIVMDINDQNRGNPVSYALWVDLFLKSLSNSSNGAINEVYGISVEFIIPLVKVEEVEYGMVTDTGMIMHTGISMDKYIDKEITVLKKDGEIISLLSLINDTPVIKNVYIAEIKPESITIFTGGIEKTYALEGAGMGEGNICDIRVSDGKALEVKVYGESITGVVKRVTANGIELGDINLFKNDPFIKVYGLSGSGGIVWRNLGNIVVGGSGYELIMHENIVKAVIIRELPELVNIRVVISTTGFGGYFHDKVSVTADTAFTVWSKNEVLNYKAGEIFSVSETENNDLFSLPRIYITTDEPDGKLQIQSISRNWPNNESPWYRGFIEIALEPDGKFTIVNEVYIEEYLYGVVPSEMPTSHGLEAAKVQAVTARSYAYNQYFANNYHRYGANVDDSVMCQVYNNIPENTTSITSVVETFGECLTYNGTVISANFFSTSAGVTANSGEVWASSATREFPAPSFNYLLSVKQYKGKSYGDLRVEENAEKFFKDTNVDAYDSAFAWFRWNVEMTKEELTRSINNNLSSRYNANPMLIKTLQSNGAFRSRPINSIGELVDMDVIERGEGGNIMALKIVGTEAVVMVYTELNIRYLLAPVQYMQGERDIIIKREGGSEVKNFSLMPSAFMVFDKVVDENNAITSVTFYGGGYGHGVGMSQNGVKGLIDVGFDYEEVLRHFYRGTQITEVY